MNTSFTKTIRMSMRRGIVVAAGALAVAALVSAPGLAPTARAEAPVAPVSPAQEVGSPLLLLNNNYGHPPRPANPRFAPPQRHHRPSTGSFGF